MATILKRNAKYLVRVRVTGSPPLSKTFLDRRAAQAWAVQTEDAVRRGVYEFGKSDLPTLGQAIKRYVKYVLPKKRGADKEAYLLQALARLPAACKALDALQASELSRLRDAWLKELAPATVLRRMAVLCHVYTVAIKDWGYDIPNPLLQVSKPRVANQRNRVIGAKELDAVLAYAPNDTLANIARMAWLSAARLGELVNLQWPDVNLVACTADLRATKNGTDRTVPLVPAACDLLEGLKPQTPLQPTGPVFATTSASMSKAWAAAVKKARKAYEGDCKAQGVEPAPDWLTNVHFHDLRHSAITRLAEYGLSTLKLAAISGHKSLPMLGRYTHIRAETLAEELARLEGTTLQAVPA